MQPTERFTGRAQAYALGRPSYPAAALDALFAGLGPPATLTVVDLGAGTGISSGLLAQRGARVIAVEPNAAMRSQAEACEHVSWLDARAEETGLAPASADLVTAFQSFHWFTIWPALREIERILRPNGRAALVYNERDETDPLTAAYGALVRRYATDRSEARRRDGRAEFAAHGGWCTTERSQISHAQTLDQAGLHARARSTSYLPAEGGAAEALRTELDDLFARFADGDSVSLQLQTTVLVAGRSVARQTPSRRTGSSPGSRGRRKSS
ncbi:MAG: class I SAM-dependent methyltransferase [Vulcanimicrobiaceae bacterium]